MDLTDLTKRTVAYMNELNYFSQHASEGEFIYELSNLGNTFNGRYAISQILKYIPFLDCYFKCFNKFLVKYPGNATRWAITFSSRIVDGLAQVQVTPFNKFPFGEFICAF